MNFAETVAEVLSKVKRPDYLEDARREVNAAIHFACTLSNFVRDLEETSIEIDGSAYAQSFETSELPRFRKVCWLKIGNCFLQPIDITSDLRRKAGGPTANKYYVAGGRLIFKTSTLANTADIGYFQYPPTLENDDEFWLLEQAPYLVIDRAAAKIFVDIGDNDSADRANASFREQLLAAQNDFTYGINKGR
jgi:hypothetical protein